MIVNVFGVKVEITFLFVAFISFVLSLKAPSNVIMTITSSMLHESGHLLMMLILHNKPEKVRFELTGINIIRKQEISVSTKNELLISLGGPIVNFFIVAICCVVLCFYNSNSIITFACINLILMTFNLLPVKKLDGGAVLYYLLYTKYDYQLCSKILNFTSIFFISLIFIWGIYIFIVSKYNFSLIIIAIFLVLAFFIDNEY
jgi:stage IV sporulation protein FB